MSRFGAAVGSGIGAIGGAFAGIGFAYMRGDNRNDLDPHGEARIVGALSGAIIGAAIGAGSGCTVVAKSIGTGGECIPLVSDPGLPFHLPSHPRFP